MLAIRGLRVGELKNSLYVVKVEPRLQKRIAAPSEIWATRSLKRGEVKMESAAQREIPWKRMRSMKRLESGVAERRMR